METAIPTILQYLRKANMYIHPIKQGDGKLHRPDGQGAKLMISSLVQRESSFRRTR